MAPPEMVDARLGPGRHVVAWAVRLARLDARRPAAWVSLATAGLVTWLLAGETAAGLQTAAGIGAGGLLAVAAIGVPAAGLPDGRRRPWTTAWLMRAVWPIGGAIAAAAVVGGGPFYPLILAATAVATALAALVAVAAGATEAAGMAVSLAVTGAAAVASLAAGFIVPSSPSVPVAAAAAAWGLAAAAAWVAGRDEAGWSTAAADRGGSAPGRRLPLAPGMPRSLVGAALITSLVTMVVCYFLVPAFDGLYAGVAGGWFLCLAVPPATTGVGGAEGRRLAAAAPGRPAVPGSIRRGIAASVPILAVLGWPAVVALVLPAADGSRSGGPLTAILVLAGAWLLLVGAMASCGRRGGEIARATVLGAAAVALAAGLPGLPGLPGPTGVSRSRSVLSPAADPAKLPGHRSHLEPPVLPLGPAVDVEISSRRSR